MQNISADAYIEPFPHLVFHNFYTDEELDLIWEELNFYTKPKKLFDVEDYHWLFRVLLFIPIFHQKEKETQRDSH